MSDVVSSGTSPSLDGYFYQLDVSILIALEFVMSRQLTPSVVLEPASKEDLETDIAEEPQALTESVELEAHRLVIQCKLRNTGPWKVGDLAALLKHGKRRPSAAKRLADTAVRYLLVTNADVDGVARNMVTTELGHWPEEKLPQEIADALSTSARGRVAVLALLNGETITSRMKERLIDRFRVPHAHFEACRRELREEAFMRMRGAAGGVWTRQDIVRVIVKHDGYSGRAEALVGFVPPKNWAEMRQILSTQHAILLTGPSGTGKTRTAKALIAQLRDELNGIAVCEVRGGPEKIREENRRPVVFDVEDPWGRYQPEPDAIAWNGSIYSLLQNAGPDRKFVITNRSDVLKESGPKNVPGKFVARLDARQYGREERARLFRLCVETLPAGLKTRVVAHWRQGLPDLETPLEMERYFDALAGGVHEDEHEEAYFRRCLKEAHQHSIEHSILLNVRSRRDAYRWAAVLWGLFKANPTQTFVTLPMIQAALTQKDLAFEDGLMPYVDFMVAGHNLRQLGPELSYQHPRVELGLQQAMQEKPELSARLLVALTQVLIGLGKSGQLGWGRAGAARLVGAAVRVEGVNFSMGAPEEAEVDDWLYARLTSPGLDFQDDLHLAASVGSQRSVVGELARWLLHRPDDTFMTLDLWVPKNVTPEWIEWIRADPVTSTICAAFVRRMLARDCRFYRTDFTQEIRKLTPDLGLAFRDAAMDNADYGYLLNAEAIADAALEDLDAFEPILTKCLDHLAQYRSRVFDDEWLAVHDGHYDDEAAEYYEQSRGEEGHTAYQFVASYVDARRVRTGWQSLREHARCADLLKEWIRAAGRDSSTSDEEWRALAARVACTESEAYFWAQATLRWPAALADVARTRLIEASADDAARIELAEVLARHLSAETADIVRQLLGKGTERVLQLACDLANVKHKPENSAVLTAAIERVAASVPQPLSDAIREAAARLPAITPIPLTLPIWRSLNTGSSRTLRLARARVLAASGDDVTGELKDLLVPLRDHDEEVEFARAALEAAIQAGQWDVFEIGLAHRFADVRKRAMEAIAQRSPDALPSELLKLATDRSHDVRDALLKLLKARRHTEHTDVLVTLASDTWTRDVRWDGHHLRFPIAEGAADMLSSPPQLNDVHGERILAIAMKLESELTAGALFSALVANGTTSGRAAVLTAALEGDSVVIRRLAAHALIAHKEQLDSSSVVQVHDVHLTKGPPRVAFALSILVGMRADIDQVMSSAKAIAAVPERRALLIPLYIVLRDRDIDTAKNVLELLPEQLAIDLRRAADEGRKLPQEALEPLRASLVGEILVNEIVGYLDRFVDKQSGNQLGPRGLS